MEILIGILLVLILLILADGARRMLRDRGSRLRLRIDPAVSRHKGDDIPETNPELIGTARVIKRSGAAPSQRQTPPVAPAEQPREKITDEREAPALFASTEVPEDDMPPLVMEAEEPPMAPVERAEQQDLFSSGSTPEAPTEGEILDVIVVHLVAAREAPFPGRELLQRVLEQGMRFGEMNIFHRHSQGDGPPNLQFSMANALEPGYFDVDEMDGQRFRAVTFFMKLPGPLQPLSALERMLTTARKLHDALGGELRDDQHSVLTPQTIEHLRQKVQDFERRQRLSHAH